MKKYGFNACSSNYIKGEGMYDGAIKTYRKGMAIDNNYLQPIDKAVYDVKERKFVYTLTSTVMMRREVIDRVGMFKMVDAEDWDLWNRVFEVERFLFIDLVLIYYDLNHAGGRHYVMRGRERK